jgi:microcystin-dependent protein
VPVGTILIWSGSIATIPLGFHLCDGTNGTPDLRSRFVYGAGNENTKTSWANGWDNVNGHWPVGQVGGEEQHILTIAEMPSHNHPMTADQRIHGFADSGTDIPTPYERGLIVGSATPAASWYGRTILYDIQSHLVTTYQGGFQPHNVLPRFMTLAYIMKL